MARQDLRMLAKDVQELKDKFSDDAGFFSGDHEDRLRQLEQRITDLEHNWVSRKDYKEAMKGLGARVKELEKGRLHSDA